METIHIKKDTIDVKVKDQNETEGKVQIIHKHVTASQHIRK